MNVYIQNDNRDFLCFDEKNNICWSQYIIDANLFSSEEEAERFRIENQLLWCNVTFRNKPPQTFLYQNRIPKNQRLYYYDHTRLVPDLWDILLKMAEDYKKE